MNCERCGFQQENALCEWCEGELAGKPFFEPETFPALLVSAGIYAPKQSHYDIRIRYREQTPTMHRGGGIW